MMEEKKTPFKQNPQLDPNFYQSKGPEKFGEDPSSTASKPTSYKIQIGNSFRLIQS